MRVDMVRAFERKHVQELRMSVALVESIFLETIKRHKPDKSLINGKKIKIYTVLENWMIHLFEINYNNKCSGKIQTNKSLKLKISLLLEAQPDVLSNPKLIPKLSESQLSSKSTSLAQRRST